MDRKSTTALSPPPSVLDVDSRYSPRIEGSLRAGSLTSDVYDYEYENGRRYHAYMAGSYPLPNDEKELERIDIKHHVMRLLCNGHLHLAPLDQPKFVLDIGTGTGIWTLEMAEKFPNTTFVGTDLSPVQPEVVPNNVHFEIDDFEAKDWAWPDNYFDYIHSRFIIGSVSSWQRLIRKAFQHTKPGGYFEMQEVNCRFTSDDSTLEEDSNLARWSRLIVKASQRYNRPIPMHTEFPSMFHQAGFVDVRQVVLKSPSNPWPKDKGLKEAGRYQLLAHVEGIEGVSLGLFTRGLGWKAEEVKILTAKLRAELKDRSIHSYQPHVVILGRKPFTPQTPDSVSGQAAFQWNPGNRANNNSPRSDPMEGRSPPDVEPSNSAPQYSRPSGFTISSILNPTPSGSSDIPRPPRGGF